MLFYILYNTIQYKELQKKGIKYYKAEFKAISSRKPLDVEVVKKAGGAI